MRVEAMFAPDTDLRDAIERMIDPEFEIHGDYQIVEKASTEPFTPTATQPMPTVLVTFNRGLSRHGRPRRGGGPSVR